MNCILFLKAEDLIVRSKKIKLNNNNSINEFESPHTNNGKK